MKWLFLAVILIGNVARAGECRLKTPIHLPHEILSLPHFSNDEVYWARNVTLDQMPNDSDFIGANGKLTLRLDQIFEVDSAASFVPTGAYSAAILSGHNEIGLSELYNGDGPKIETARANGVIVQRISEVGEFPYRTVVTITQTEGDIVGIEIDIPDRSETHVTKRQKICVLAQTEDHFGQPRLD